MDWLIPSGSNSKALLFILSVVQTSKQMCEERWGRIDNVKYLYASMYYWTFLKTCEKLNILKLTI